MADDENEFEGNIDEHEDFSGDFANDDFSGTDLFDEEDEINQSDDDKEEYQFEESGQDLAFEDENFQFTDEEDADDYDTLSSKAPNFIQQHLQKMKNQDPKKLVLFAGVGIFVFILIITVIIKVVGNDQQKNSTLTTMGQKSDSKTHNSPVIPQKQTPSATIQQARTVDTTAIQQAQTPSNMATQTATLAINPLTAPSETKTTMLTEHSDSYNKGFQEHVKLRFNQTKSVLENMQDEIKILENQYAQNTQTIDKLANSLNNIEEKVLTVNETLTKIIDIVKKHEETEKAHHHAAVTENKPSTQQQALLTKQGPYESMVNNYKPALPSYHVQAVIPGRAWLKDNEGRIVSVGIGDQITGYGTVTKIEQRSGAVMTSSGVKIEYGIDQY